MKKTNLIFLALLLHISVFVSAQDGGAAEEPQKPLKEDFFHTWVTEAIIANKIYSFEVTYLNESSYVLTSGYGLVKIKQNYAISKWEEALNVFDGAEEYPSGFKIYAKETKNNTNVVFYMFINADKTHYLSVAIALGGNTEYHIYRKKNKK